MTSCPQWVKADIARSDDVHESFSPAYAGAWQLTRASPDQPQEDGFMKRLLEMHATDMAFHPTDPTFERFKSIEFDPHPLAHGGRFDELDPATFTREIEDPDAERVDTRSSDADLGCQRHALGATRRLV